MSYLGRIQPCTDDCPPRCSGGCSQCGAHRPDLVGLTLAQDGSGLETDYGFCSVSCFVLFTRQRWIDGGQLVRAGSPVGSGEKGGLCPAGIERLAPSSAGTSA